MSAIPKLIPSEKKNQTILTVKHNDEQTTDPLDKANIFNSYFTGVGESLGVKITKDPNYVEPAIREPDVALRLLPVTPAVIRKHIDSLPNNKSSGIRDLPIRAIKAAKDIISTGLTHIINQIFEQDIIPEKWKSSYKGGQKDIVSIYRPISVLPFTDKILERIIKENLMDHLERQYCITENQGGYRKNYSTITMTRKLVDYILLQRENKTPTVAVFLDLSKAFDTISHAGLITKLELYGIKGHELKLIKNYHSRRVQQTSINGTLSDPKEINFGVPQGSVLGPIFLILFINNLPKVIKHSEVCRFADDTVIYNSKKNTEALEKELKEDLISVSNWLNNNELTINIKKSKVMTFNTRTKKMGNINLQINRQNFDIVDSYKYLGLIIDDKLSFQKHFYNIAGRASHKLRKLKEIRGHINDHTAVTIFKSLKKNLFDYCDAVWDAAGVTLKNKLQSIQDKALQVAHQNEKDMN